MPEKEITWDGSLRVSRRESALVFGDEGVRCFTHALAPGEPEPIHQMMARTVAKCLIAGDDDFVNLLLAKYRQYFGGGVH